MAIRWAVKFFYSEFPNILEKYGRGAEEDGEKQLQSIMLSKLCLKAKELVN